jgi:hypothetical protein
MIKKYNDFVKPVNEYYHPEDKFAKHDGSFNGDDSEEEDNGFAKHDGSFDGDDSEEDTQSNDLPEEEGGEYQGQILLNQLANELGTEVDSDGSINYEGKKINFYSETDKFHVDNKKFSTVEEVINYLGSDSMESDDEMNYDGDDASTLPGTNYGDEDDKFESKSYKYKILNKFTR